MASVLTSNAHSLPAEPPLKRDTPSTLPEPVTCALLREQHFGKFSLAHVPDRKPC